MKRMIRISLKLLAVIIVIAVIVGIGGWWYLNSTFLNFEKGYVENSDIKEISIDDFTFKDRNGNNRLDIYEDHRKPIEDRVKDLLLQMTLDEKIHLLKGSGLASAMGRGKTGIPGAVGTIVPTPRLGIPTIYLSDGPAGLRLEPKRKGQDRTFYCTAFPIASMLSSTWNSQLVREVGIAMGTEAREYGIDVVLGPGVNIHRHPFCGRNFEYYSEDPVLSGLIGSAMVNGIESQGVGSSVKHFVANNQETERNTNDVIVSERAMREIYLKGFEIIVERSQPWTIMSSYNKVNGTYTSQSKTLLTDILRDEWKFEGLVMTDWFGGNDAPAQVTAGNDLIEPGTKKQWKALKKAANKGTLTEESINTSVGRILNLIFHSRKMQNYQYGNNPDLEAHAKVTRQSAAEGIVLLKNNDILPINNTQNIALLGLTSYDFIAGGTGSGDVNEAYTISLEQGLKNAGFKINEQAKKAFELHRANNSKAFEKPHGINAMLKPYYPPRMTYSKDEISEIASSSDIGIITIGRNSGEGGDRIEKDDFLLSDKELTMITDACEIFHAAGKKIAVVLNVGGVIETASWKSKPDAIVLAWQGGQEGGNSVVDVLSGTVNASGRLPMTFPIHVKDHASHANFPLEGGTMNFGKMLFGSGKVKPDSEKIKNEDFTNYEEDIYVGYRHFDKRGLEVSYPFGYGLSYTRFDYSNLSLSLEKDTINISVDVKNVGETAGKEVVQIYTSLGESKINRPVKELRTFAKTNTLQQGEKTTIDLDIPIKELRYWSEERSNWHLEQGNYTIHVGHSSRDIPLTGEIEIN